MSKRVLIVKNVSREGPGLLEAELRSRGLPFEVVDLEAGQALPPSAEIGALVVLGGPDSANDRTAKIRGELDLVADVMNRGVPCLGICLGLQLMVRAAGGRVVRNPVAEVGLRDPAGEPFTVELTAAGEADPLFAGLPDSFRVFHLHGETVEPTSAMSCLAVGRHCRNQVVRVAPRAYGIQCHFELTPTMLEAWIVEDPDLGSRDGSELLEEFAGMAPAYERIGRTLMGNFLEIAFV